MRVRVWARTVLDGMVLIGLMGCATAACCQSGATPAASEPDHGMAMGKETTKPAVPSGPLKISFGDKSAEWTAATLAVLPHKTVTLYNEHAKATQTYSGVELIDLLKPLGVAEKPHGKDLALYVIAAGSDGYQVTYSIGEVTPDVHDGTVLVADSMDSKPLGATGPLQLVSTREKRPARWVRNLVAIRVRAAE